MLRRGGGWRRIVFLRQDLLRQNWLQQDVLRQGSRYGDQRKQFLHFLSSLGSNPCGSIRTFASAGRFPREAGGECRIDVPL
jgi:hypothetical protein